MEENKREAAVAPRDLPRRRPSQLGDAEHGPLVPCSSCSMSISSTNIMPRHMSSSTACPRHRRRVLQVPALALASASISAGLGPRTLLHLVVIWAA